MLPNKIARSMIAAAVRTVADDVCKDHYVGLTQEPPLTARIGQALESEIRNMNVEGYRLRVITSDVPDRGRDSLESRFGADLYVGIQVTAGGKTQSKGFLVQAKWATATGPKEMQRLEDQCRKMLARSQDSYVWVYGSTGVRVISAQRIVDGPRFERFGGKRLDNLLSRVLECTAGDRKIGIPAGPQPRQRVEAMLRDLGVQRGSSFPSMARMPLIDSGLNGSSGLSG